MNEAPGVLVGGPLDGQEVSVPAERLGDPVLVYCHVDHVDTLSGPAFKLTHYRMARSSDHEPVKDQRGRLVLVYWGSSTW